MRAPRLARGLPLLAPLRVAPPTAGPAADPPDFVRLLQLADAELLHRTVSVRIIVGEYRLPEERGTPE